MFFVALAALFAVIYDGGLVPAEAIEGRRWYFAVMGIGLLILGVDQLILGLAAVFSRGPLDPELELLCALWMACVILAMVAVMATYAALAAWFPELPAKFEGGLTGTITEHRIVWTIVAVVIDLLALPFVVAVPLGTIGWIARKARQSLRGSR